MFLSGYLHRSQHAGGTSGGTPEPSADIVERHYMKIRKIAAAATFATGAAVALAPFAQADPVEIASTVSSEIASLNSLFDFEATLAGVGAHVIPGTAANPFDTIPLADAPQATVPS